MRYQRIKKGKKSLIYAVFFLILFVFSLFFPIFRPQKPSFSSVLAREEGNPFGWEEISAYTTYFNENDVGRCENITIAAALIDGVTIQPYGEFSFNATVGARTAEAGFQQAKIIVNGEYVLGVGGGVCQVSTTLYNAALKSGLTAIEYHPHSLAVSYVEPSRDAMVSSHSDLKLYNPHSVALHLRAKVFSGCVKVTFYGKNVPDRYEIVSKKIAEILPPPPIVKAGESDGVLRVEKAGVKSEMYLERYRGERLLSRKRLRVDEYRPIQGIIVKKNVLSTEKMPSNVCLLEGKML